MKSSLASATSLIALLAFEASTAHGAVVITLQSNPSANEMTIYGLVGAGATQNTELATVTGANNSTLKFSTVSSGNFTGGGQTISVGSGGTGSLTGTYNYVAATTSASNSVNVTVVDGSTTKTLTLMGTGVAPIANVSVTNTNTLGGGTSNTGNLGYILVGQSTAAAITVSNSGNGNLAYNEKLSSTGTQIGTLSNLRGTISSASNAVFTGASSTFSLNDKNLSTVNGTATTSGTYNYVFTPTTTGAQTGTVVSNFANGAASTNGARSITTTLTGTGVAPIVSLTATASAGYVLVGQSATATLTLNNTGNGNLSGQGTISNLRGTVGTASNTSGTGFGAGSSTAASLKDTTTATYSYVYTPTITGATTATIASTFVNGSADKTNSSSTLTSNLVGTGVAPVASVSSTNVNYVRIGTSGTGSVVVSNTGNGNLSGLGTISNLRGSITNAVGTGFSAVAPSSISLADASSTTVGYTYTPLSHASTTATATISLVDGSTNGMNQAQTLTASVAAQGVGPTFQSKLGATVDTATAVAGGATGTATSTISFGTAGYGSSTTIFLNLSNITTDAGAASLTDLTIENFSITGTNAGSFSTSFTKGTVIHEGGSVFLPITVVGAQLGLMTANLTLFTDEGSALGGAGDTFTYLLSIRIPEPGSIAVLGAGLAGLASLRRRRKQRAAASTG